VLAVLVAAVVATVGVSAWFLGRPWIRQGVYGHVILLEGGCMPPTTPYACRESAVSRLITIRAPTPWTATYRSPQEQGTTIIASSSSGVDGYYEIALPPGRYSVFVEDRGQEYCNRLTGDGIACPLEVPAGRLNVDLQIDHATR